MGQRGSGASKLQLSVVGAGRRAPCCPQEARAISPLGRYLSLALTVSHVQNNWQCAIGLGQARGKIAHFPAWGLCVCVDPLCTLVLGWTLRLFLCLEASGDCKGSVLVLGHPSDSALPHILSLVLRDESLGCKTPSAPSALACVSP